MPKFLRGIGLGRFLYRSEVGLGYDSRTEKGLEFSRFWPVGSTGVLLENENHSHAPMPR